MNDEDFVGLLAGIDDVKTRALVLHLHGRLKDLEYDQAIIRRSLSFIRWATPFLAAGMGILLGGHLR